MIRKPILAAAFALLALLGGLLSCTQQDYGVTVSPNADPAMTAKTAASGKVSLCHVTGNGGYNLITVSANAEAAHLAHGDKSAPVGATSATACSTPNLPPEITNPEPEYNFPTGIPIQFSLGTLTDPDGNGPWTVSVDWGDFGPPELVPALTLGPMFLMHSYALKGFYQITVVATDAAGASSAPVYIYANVFADEGEGEE